MVDTSITNKTSTSQCVRVALNVGDAQPKWSRREPSLLAKVLAEEPFTNLKRSRLVFVILGVGTQVLDVKRRQSGDEQFQLLFIEDGDESLGDDAVEAVKERLQLFLYRSGHFHLTDELHVLLLVLLRHVHVAPIRLQVTNFRHTKLLNLQPMNIPSKMRSGIMPKLKVRSRRFLTGYQHKRTPILIILKHILSRCPDSTRLLF